MKHKYGSYLKLGLTIIGSVTICLIIFFLFYRSKELGQFLSKLGDVLFPVIIGAVLAYLINPIVNFFNKCFLRLFQKLKFSHRVSGNLALGLSIGLSVALLLLIIAALLLMILPELYDSVLNLVNNYDSYGKTIQNWFENLHILKEHPEWKENISELLDKLLISLEDWVSTELLGKLSNILSGLTFKLIGVFNTFVDAMVGLIVSIYILYSKRKYIGKAKKLTYALFKPQVANTILHMSSRCNQIFGGFISGKLLDSLIIGMMCFLGLSLFHTPYTLLVSFIVGITNIIPFFGPFIGAVPSAILILLADPTNLKPVIIFVIFVFCLQQFDGNILGPKILGDSTGLSALMVVISILFGGGFFGFLGMILGVPLFAVMHYLIQCFVNYRLSKRGLPTDTVNYLDLTSVNEEAGEMHYTISGFKTANGKQAILTHRIHNDASQVSFTASMQEEIDKKEKVIREQADEAARASIQRHIEKKGRESAGNAEATNSSEDSQTK